MSHARMTQLFGLGSVLYLAAHAASMHAIDSVIEIIVCAVAVGIALLPSLLLRSWPTGASRVSVLGSACAFLVVLELLAPNASILLEQTSAIAFGLVGGLLLDVALTVPDRPRLLDRVWLRVLARAGAFVVTGAAVLGALAPIGLSDPWMVIPSWAEQAPPWLAALAVGLALFVHASRRWVGSPADIVASSTWPVTGLAIALLALVVRFALIRLGGESPLEAAPLSLSMIAAIAISISHLALIDESRRLYAGSMTRRLVALAIALLAIGALGGVLSRVLEVAPPIIAMSAALGALAFVMLEATLVSALDRRLAPWSGRLLLAVAEAREALATASDLGEVGAAVLRPMRRASRQTDSQPVLFVVAPPLEVRLDAAGQPQIRTKQPPEALMAHLAEAPGETLDRAVLDNLVVRRPALRPIALCLEALDALAVMPLAVHGELEGAIAIPRGDRRSRLALEERHELAELARRAAGVLSIMTENQRMSRRIVEAGLAVDRRDEEVERLMEENARLHKDVQVLARGRSASRLRDPLVSYSRSMRTLGERLRQLAPGDAPVLIIAEAGSPVDRVAGSIHDASGRAAGPFVVADCMALTEPLRALFGTGEEPGLLELARGGTLLLADVVALPLAAQERLATCLTQKQGTAIDAAKTYDLDVRVVSSSRVELSAVGQTSGDLENPDAPGTAKELLDLHGGAILRVPPLRERREDLPSLVLLALARSCRVLGRAPVGIEQAALEALLVYDFPGNQRELQHIVDRAVMHARGARVTARDLPPFPAESRETAPREHPFVGTYAELEKRILQAAIDRSAGNKSEAARSLGLKRTTFLDKLRRYGLDDLPARRAN